MTDTEQPDTPPLTRKQLREIRNTGATPVITTDAASEPPRADEGPVEVVEPTPPPAPTPAPLPRPAEPVIVAAAPIADAAVDLGVSPLTRRQARQQERIRTASVPVITPEVAAAHAASAAPAPISSVPGASTPTEEPADELDAIFAPPAQQDDAAPAEPDAEDDSERVVSPLLGAGVIAGEPVEIDLPPSFDQLLARGSTGAIGAQNALILSQSSGDSPIVAPVTATGEVIVTGTFNLPEGLGSTGHALGTADGKETDAVLVDGELPAHSSPTPIAASAAISTVKSAGDVIKPPAPEKGSRLMLWLAITAGVLALALVGVLILAFVTGVL
ncbi:MAG: hypothetical protein ABW024_00070 [Microbacterium sp.]